MAGDGVGVAVVVPAEAVGEGVEDEVGVGGVEVDGEVAQRGGIDGAGERGGEA